MASDWPGVPSYIRFPHPPTCCGCRRYFQIGQEPPPWYLSTGSTHTSPYWAFLEPAFYLAGQGQDPFAECSWKSRDFEPSLDALEQSILTFGPSAEGPDFYEVELIAIIAVGLILAIASNRTLPLPLLASPNPRSTVYTFSGNNWGWSGQGSVIIPLPDGTMSLEPIACIPGWNVGDPIPDP